MQLYVKTPTGATITLVAEDSDTVYVIKTKLHSKASIGVFSGLFLKTSHCSLLTTRFIRPCSRHYRMASPLISSVSSLLESSSRTDLRCRNTISRMSLCSICCCHIVSVMACRYVALLMKRGDNDCTIRRYTRLLTLGSFSLYLML